jgi:hypothetical protein
MLMAPPQSGFAASAACVEVAVAGITRQSAAPAAQLRVSLFTTHLLTGSSRANFG